MQLRRHAPLSWDDASRLLRGAGYTVERNENGAAIVKRDGADIAFGSLPKPLRQAWNALSVDDASEWGPFDDGAQRPRRMGWLHSLRMPPSGRTH